MESTSPLKPKRKDKTEVEREEPRNKLARLEKEEIVQDKKEVAVVEELSINAAYKQKQLQQLPAELELSLNALYKQKHVTQWLQSAWSKGEAKEQQEAETSAQIYSEPFQIGLLPELLEGKDTSSALVQELIHKVHWSRKQMDLYEFYQSTDLSNLTDCRLLTNFLQLLRKQVRPWLEQVTNLKLDYVSASCSMYTCGDYLLVHDDLLKDRQIAFVYYLTPWQGVEEWQEAQGGCLEIFSSDGHNFPQFPVQRKIPPKNNQFAFFKVGSRSFHQVGEVTTYDYPRLTINGWFHGATNESFSGDNSRALPRLQYLQPHINNRPTLGLLLNDVYLKSATRRSIQKRIEENSEICLYEFFKREKFEQARAQLLKDQNLSWRRQGPANAHNYELLELETARGTVVEELLQLFRSNAMFQLLRDFTDLDLYGSDAITPTCSVELQRWSHGNYTVLGDGMVSEENTLDLVYYLNAGEGAAVITYLSPEVEQRPPADSSVEKSTEEETEEEDTDADETCNDDSVLLTITPVDNALNIVYRCEGTTKFTKYVSRNTPLDKGPVFVISCSYRE